MIIKKTTRVFGSGGGAAPDEKLKTDATQSEKSAAPVPEYIPVEENRAYSILPEDQVRAITENSKWYVTSATIPLSRQKIEEIQNSQKDISQDEIDWDPIERISECLRPIVMLARTKVMELFSGKLPQDGVEIDGKLIGNLQKSPIRRFVAKGIIIYTTKNMPATFWDKVVNCLLGVIREKKLTYHFVGLTKDDKVMVEQFKQEGIEAWNSATGPNRIVTHPGVMVDLRTAKERRGKKSGGQGSGSSESPSMPPAPQSTPPITPTSESASESASYEDLGQEDLSFTDTSLWSEEMFINDTVFYTTAFTSFMGVSRL